MRIVTGFRDFLDRFFGPNKTEITLADGEATELKYSIYFKELAIAAATSIIANAISKCEFKTYYKHELSKSKIYYMWNVAPNVNQNSSQFIHEFVEKLCKNGEALVIDIAGQLLCADSYSVDDQYALYEYTFSNIVINGKAFDKVFKRSEVCYYKLNNENITALLDGLYSDYGKLMQLTMKNYSKSWGSKWKMKVETNRADKIKKDQQERDVFADLMGNKMKKFFDADNAVYPEYNGYELTNIIPPSAKGNIDDVIKMRKEIFEIIAQAYHIPPKVLMGDVAGISDVTDNLISLCIDPIVDMISEENTKQIYKFEGWNEGNYMEISTAGIKQRDVIKEAANIEKVITSGFMNIDEVREEFGKRPLDTEFSKQYWMTKNAATIEEVLKAVEE